MYYSLLVLFSSRVFFSLFLMLYILVSSLEAEYKQFRKKFFFVAHFIRLLFEWTCPWLLRIRKLAGYFALVSCTEMNLVHCCRRSFLQLWTFLFTSISSTSFSVFCFVSSIPNKYININCVWSFVHSERASAAAGAHTNISSIPLDTSFHGAS